MNRAETETALRAYFPTSFEITVEEPDMLSRWLYITVIDQDGERYTERRQWPVDIADLIGSIEVGLQEVRQAGLGTSALIVARPSSTRATD